MRRSRLVTAFLAFLAVSPAQGVTLLTFNSEPGDPIGGGQQSSLTPADGMISASHPSIDRVSVGFNSAGAVWSLDFVAPTRAALQPGIYEGAASYPTQSLTLPGLRVSRNNLICSALTGRFVVLEAVYGTGNTVQQLAVDYEQHCDGRDEALFGSVRINSSVPLEPRLSAGSVQVYEGDAHTLQMYFVISLSAPSPAPVSVDYATMDGTATGGEDYTPVSGTAELPAGETEVFVPVLLAGDEANETDETFSLSLDYPQGASISFNPGLGTIVDDDPFKTLLHFNSQPGDWVGQGRRFTVTPVDGMFTAARNFDNGVTVSFAGNDHWYTEFAAAGDAFLTPGVYTGAVQFPRQPVDRHGLSIFGAGRSCGPLTGRFVVLEIVYGAGSTVERFAADYEQHCEGVIPALFGSVRYNSTVPLAPRLFIGPAAVTEGNTGTVGLSFPLWLSEPLAAPAELGFATADGTALGGVDYASRSGLLSLPAGTASASVTVQVTGDTLDEPDETLDLLLNQPSGLFLGVDCGVGTIVDDDPLPLLSVGDAEVAEGDPGRPGTARFEVTLSTASGRSVCFQYATVPDTAQVGTDFVDTSGSACLSKGTTSFVVNVPLVGDLQPEAEEDFSQIVTAVTSATVVDGQGLGVVGDDDSATDFFTLTPCRLLDTRLAGPAVGANTVLPFAVAGLCGVPATARSVVLNLTAVDPTHVGTLRLYASAAPAPPTSALTFSPGRIVAGNALATLGAGGGLTIQCDMAAGVAGGTHVVVDVFGYFE